MNELEQIAERLMKEGYDVELNRDDEGWTCYVNDPTGVAFTGDAPTALEALQAAVRDLEQRTAVAAKVS